MKTLLTLAAVLLLAGGARGQPLCEVQSSPYSVTPPAPGKSCVTPDGKGPSLWVNEPITIKERTCSPNCLVPNAWEKPTTPRTYTLDEIDRMRAAEMKIVNPNPIQVMHFDGKCYPAIVSSEASGTLMQIECPPDYTAVVEERVRTDMAAGISPDKLEKRAKEKP